jgi:hypothetical protein
MDELVTCDGWRTPANAWVPCWRAPEYTVRGEHVHVPVYACRRHLASAVDRVTDDTGDRPITVERH